MLVISKFNTVESALLFILSMLLNRLRVGEFAFNGSNLVTADVIILPIFISLFLLIL